MNIYELQSYAKENGNIEFVMTLRNGLEFDGYFIDAWFGMVKIPEFGDGFIMLSRLADEYGIEQFSFEVVK